MQGAVSGGLGRDSAAGSGEDLVERRSTALYDKAYSKGGSVLDHEMSKPPVPSPYSIGEAVTPSVKENPKTSTPSSKPRQSRLSETIRKTYPVRLAPGEKITPDPLSPVQLKSNSTEGG